QGLVYLGDMVAVFVLAVLQDMEAEAARLVSLGPERVRLDGGQEAFPQPGPDTDLHPECQHRSLLLVAAASCGRSQAVLPSAPGHPAARSTNARSFNPERQPRRPHA